MTSVHEDARRAGWLAAAVGLSVTVGAVGDVALGGALGPLFVRLAIDQPLSPVAGALEAGVCGSAVWLAFGA